MAGFLSGRQLQCRRQVLAASSAWASSEAETGTSAEAAGSFLRGRCRELFLVAVDKCFKHLVQHSGRGIRVEDASRCFEFGMEGCVGVR